MERSRSPTLIMVCNMRMAYSPGHAAIHCSRVLRLGTLNLPQSEIFLARTAFGTSPIDRHILPARAGDDAFFRQPRGFVIDKTADQAHVSLVNGDVGCCHCQLCFS